MTPHPCTYIHPEALARWAEAVLAAVGRATAHGRQDLTRWAAAVAAAVERAAPITDYQPDKTAK